MDRGPWWATVHGVAESYMTEELTLLHSSRGQTEGARTIIPKAPEQKPQPQKVKQNEKRTFFSNKGTRKNLRKTAK